MVILKKSIIFQCFRGGATFSRGWGVDPNANCYIETHITCGFPEGVRTPCPPSHGIYQGLSWKHGKGLPNFNRQMVFSNQL